MSARIDENKTIELILYRSKDGAIQLDAQLEKETIWLSLNQLSLLFERDKSVVSRHLRNVYKEGELSREATVAKNATVQNEAGREVTRNIEYFNLDAIISVGYRVNSKRGTEFRIWATNILTQHIVQGYTLNEKRLRELKQTLKLASDISKRKTLSGDEASILLQTISEYAGARNAMDGQQTKTEMIYHYLTGPRFKQRVEAIVEAFSSMQDDLNKERKVITKQWVKRQEQIERVMQSTVGMYGDLQGIAGQSLQEIEGLEMKALEL